jgi:2-desacetyl-2-hydroxyethyl bacteriochlorophyllide A dehydrogenase
VRALVFTAPRRAEVQDVPAPVAEAGGAVVRVERAGICGTDVELYTGEMAYFGQGLARYPLRPGHEWMGTVVEVGSAADSAWVGARVTGDTMLGCGHCVRCATGRHHLCDARYELGIRGGLPGALAELLAVPVTSLRRLPANVDEADGALVEPGGNAMRAVDSARIGRGDRVLVLGPGTIGLLAVQIAVARGALVEVAGSRPPALELALRMGAVAAHRIGDESIPRAAYASVIDTTSSAGSPASALGYVEPGGSIVLVGLSGEPSLVDTRDVALADVTMVGILGASAGLDATIDYFATGRMSSTGIVAEVVSLDEVPARLRGERGAGAGQGPKIHVDPRILGP